MLDNGVFPPPIFPKSLICPYSNSTQYCECDIIKKNDKWMINMIPMKIREIIVATAGVE